MAGDRKSKKSRKSALSEDDQALSRIQALEGSIKDSLREANGLVELLQYLESASSKVVSEALGALRRSFTRLLRKGHFSISQQIHQPSASSTEERPDSLAERDGASEKAAAEVAGWLRARHRDFIAACIVILRSEHASNQTLALHTLISHFKREIEERPDVTATNVLTNGDFRKVVDVVFSAPEASEDLLRVFIGMYANEYGDVLVATLYIVRGLCKSIVRQENASEEDMQRVCERLYALLCECDIGMAVARAGDSSAVLVPASAASADGVDDADDIEAEDGDVAEGVASCVTSRTIRHAYARAWLMFLKLKLPLPLFKRILAVLDEQVIPFMPNPLLLSDFLTISYDQGGVVSVLSLQSLFSLMTKHGLEYPRYFEKLYRLLTPQLLRVRHRSKFLRLCELSLRSTHIQQYIVAAFAKRLARLALTAPPSGAIACLSMVFNLLQRHSGCRPLVLAASRQKVLAESSRGEHEDPFDPTADDPRNCGAGESSLWEIKSLEQHYTPAVAKLARSFGPELQRKLPVPLDPQTFLADSYADEFAVEFKRKRKGFPTDFRERQGLVDPERDQAFGAAFRAAEL